MFKNDKILNLENKINELEVSSSKTGEQDKQEIERLEKISKEELAPLGGRLKKKLRIYQDIYMKREQDKPAPFLMTYSLIIIYLPGRLSGTVNNHRRH